MKPALAGGVALALAAILCSQSALGFENTLTPAQVEAAVAEGNRQAADPAHGFRVDKYVLFDRPNPLHLSGDDQLVDAVLVGTPTERLLYQSYLAAIQGEPLNAAKARELAASYKDTIAFRIFAHSTSGADSDRDFMKKFGNFQLKLNTGETLRPSAIETFGPSQDFFITAGGQHVFRWLGAITVSFDLRGVKGDATKARGTLSFTDQAGIAHSYPVDLGRFV